MILALDIAFANLGWAVMDKGVPVAFGTIKTEKTKKKNVRVSDDFAFRCGEFAHELKAIIDQYKPVGVVGEMPHGAQNAVAAKSLGGAVGIITAVATCYSLPCEWISEGDSKKAALGKRKAVKEEAMDWVRDKHPDTEFSSFKTHFEHVADAIMAYHGLKNGVLVRAFG